MTRETRIALLIGLVFIVLFGLVLGKRALPTGATGAPNVVTSMPVSHPAPELPAHAVLEGTEDPPVEVARHEPAPLPVDPPPTIVDRTPPHPEPTTMRSGDPVPPPPVHPDPTATMRKYTVQAGDTPSKIAKKVYGQDKYFQRILDANKDTVRDATKLVVGTVISIPPPPAGVVTPVPPTPDPTVVVVPVPPPVGPSTRIYTIKPGDTIGTISQKETGTCKNADKLIKANPGLDPKKLVVGKTIVIPVVTS